MDGEQRGLLSGTPVNNVRRRWGKNWGHGPPHNCPIFRFCFAIVKYFLCFFFAPPMLRLILRENRCCCFPQLLPESRWPSRQIFSILAFTTLISRPYAGNPREVRFSPARS